MKNDRKEFFEITSISRDDLESVGFDVSNVTDEQMKKLAEYMARDYFEQLFWTSMKIIGTLIGIPKKK